MIGSKTWYIILHYVTLLLTILICRVILSIKWTLKNEPLYINASYYKTKYWIWYFEKLSCLYVYDRLYAILFEKNSTLYGYLEQSIIRDT